MELIVLDLKWMILSLQMLLILRFLMIFNKYINRQKISNFKQWLKKL